MQLTKKNILIIGFGIVGIPCAYAISRMNPRRFYIIDMKKEDDLNEKIPPNAKFYNFEVTKENYKSILERFKLDIIIDLSVYVNTFDMIRYCAQKRIHFITTSVEPWQPTSEMQSKESIAYDMIELQKIKNEIPIDNTMVINSGMNPGCISYFLRILLDNFSKSKKSHIEKAKDLGIQTIHIAEIDTQIEKQKNTKAFRNTWSIDGFYEEASAHSEIAFGSHELKIPRKTKIVEVNKYCKIAVLPEKGFKVQVESYLPGYILKGRVIQHAEIASMCNYLSDEDYSPSVYYAYQYSKPLQESIVEYGIEGAADLDIENKPLDSSNASGIDFLGILAICESLDMYFAGTKVSSAQALKLGLPHIGPTNCQVLGGIMSALALCVKRPHYGLLASCDEVPLDDMNIIWKHAKPYLGDIILKKLPNKAKSTQFSELILS
ncbi:MAG: saccharopine dehydrogenase NADP-binding domain-containing protein [Methanobacterium sp.]